MLKRQEAIAIIVLAGLIIGGEIVSARVSTSPFPLFFNRGPLVAPSESENSMFSVMDPQLGYSHNPGYVKTLRKSDQYMFDKLEHYRRLESDFIAMDYRPADSPIKIAILGSSGSDPFLFDGNWPWFLHLALIKRNIPHLIYNGSVSGYNSTQQLIKMIRDVFVLDQMNLVIACNGPSDAPSSGDIVEHHPNIHPFLLHSINGYLGNVEDDDIVEPVYLPNIQHQFLRLRSGILSSTRRPVQLGARNDDPVRTLVENTELMKQVALLHNAVFLHFFQPTMEDPRQLRSADKKRYELSYSPSAYVDFEIFKNQALARLASLDYSHRLQSVLPPNLPLFHDFSHVDTQGSALVAAEVLRVMDQSVFIREK